MDITFEPFQESHFPLMLTWLETPHVKMWWDQDITYTLDRVREKYGSYVQDFKPVDGEKRSMAAYIIYADAKPIGYIQLYNAHDFPRSKPLVNMPIKLGGFDVFLGEEDYAGKGLGSLAIASFLREHARAFTHVFADPDQENMAAIRAYEKAGFKRMSEHDDTHEVWMLWENNAKENHDVVSIHTAEHYVWGERCDGWWLKKGNSFTVISELMPSGAAEVAHFHKSTDQFFYVLEGELSMAMNGVNYNLKTGEGIHVPAGVIHKAQNASDGDVRLLAISCPDSHRDRVEVEET